MKTPIIIAWITTGGVVLVSFITGAFVYISSSSSAKEGAVVVVQPSSSSTVNTNNGNGFQQSSNVFNSTNVSVFQNQNLTMAQSLILEARLRATLKPDADIDTLGIRFMDGLSRLTLSTSHTSFELERVNHGEAGLNSAGEAVIVNRYVLSSSSSFPPVTKRTLIPSAISDVTISASKMDRGIDEPKEIQLVLLLNGQEVWSYRQPAIGYHRLPDSVTDDYVFSINQLTSD